MLRTWTRNSPAARRRGSAALIGAAAAAAGCDGGELAAHQMWIVTASVIGGEPPYAALERLEAWSATHRVDPWQLSPMAVTLPAGLFLRSREQKLAVGVLGRYSAGEARVAVLYAVGALVSAVVDEAELPSVPVQVLAAADHPSPAGGAVWALHQDLADPEGCLSDAVGFGLEAAIAAGAVLGGRIGHPALLPSAWAELPYFDLYQAALHGSGRAA